MSREKTALLVSPFEEDHVFLDEVFFHQGWTLYKAPRLAGAVAFLNENPVSVVITERDLPLGGWKDVLEAIRHLPDAPLLIVASKLVDEHLWAEVLNLGGQDVIYKPFQLKELLWVLNSAWLHRAPNEIETPYLEDGMARCEAVR